MKDCNAQPHERKEITINQEAFTEVGSKGEKPSQDRKHHVRFGKCCCLNAIPQAHQLLVCRCCQLNNTSEKDANSCVIHDIA